MADIPYINTQELKSYNAGALEKLKTKFGGEASFDEAVQLNIIR